MRCALNSVITQTSTCGQNCQHQDTTSYVSRNRLSITSWTTPLWLYRSTSTILMSLQLFASNHFPSGHQLACLEGTTSFLRTLPPQTACMPDMMVWCNLSITFIECTIPFESGREATALRKQEEHAYLLARWTAANCNSKLVIREVGSGGFLNSASYDHFYVCLRSST